MPIDKIAPFSIYPHMNNWTHNAHGCSKKSLSPDSVVHQGTESFNITP